MPRDQPSRMEMQFGVQTYAVCVGVFRYHRPDESQTVQDLVLTLVKMMSTPQSQMPTTATEGIT